MKKVTYLGSDAVPFEWGNIKSLKKEGKNHGIKIGDNVHIGDNANIGSDVTIEPHAKIGHYVCIGDHMNITVDKYVKIIKVI